MWREAHVLPSRTGSISLDRLCRRSRFILVRVLEGAREVDGFQASSPQTLRAALRPIYRHLPRGRGKVHFTGVEEKRLLPGLRRRRQEVELESLEEALAFLAPGRAPVLAARRAA